MPTHATPAPNTPMAQVLGIYPGARRALFRKYHIGGCSSCGFSPSETLGQLCERNGNLLVDEVLAHLQASQHQDDLLTLSPSDLASARTSSQPVRLLDIRTREEWDATRIPGAEFVNQELVQHLMGSNDRQTLLVFYDHTGTQSLDAAAYFAGHGFQNARALKGGIDAYAAEVDPSIPRYRLESAPS